MGTARSAADVRPAQRRDEREKSGSKSGELPAKLQPTGCFAVARSTVARTRLAQQGPLIGNRQGSYGREHRLQRDPFLHDKGNVLVAWPVEDEHLSPGSPGLNSDQVDVQVPRDAGGPWQQFGAISERNLAGQQPHRDFLDDVVAVGSSAATATEHHRQPT